ncbi:MAG: aminotransferase class V-fold PLP-dependent enzyme [Phycisphaeraceae bacterium]|nr:aminotransferase class V-fold PLP-dependent enzyme [Phycisphaeraceae bacterium]
MPQAIAPPAPLWTGESAPAFLLDPSITYLNHGSFGAVPVELMDSQERWRRAIESRPIELLGRRVSELMAPSKRAVAELLHCQPAEVGFVTNATEAINGVLASLQFEPGDELLTTSHVYNAIRQAMKWTARRWGASVRECPLPLPCRSADELARTIIDALRPETRLLVIDHVTSATALILPIEPIIAVCRQRGIPLLIDGAHAPGMIPVDLAALDADFYTANLHKWLFVPKGCGILRVSEAWRSRIHPAVVSHFLGEGFEREFDWQGTRDISPWVVAAEALDFFRRLGPERVMSHNHALACWAHAHLCERLDSEPLSPLDGSLLGSMATVRLPERFRPKFESIEALGAHLYEKERIEVPVIDFEGHWHVRVSAQIYNRPHDYERLGEALLRAAPA